MGDTPVRVNPQPEAKKTKAPPADGAFSVNRKSRNYVFFFLAARFIAFFAGV